MHPLRALAISIAIHATIVSCTNQGAESSTAGGGSEFRLERYCAVDGLPRSMRHTYVLLDEKSISRSETAEAFAGTNRSLRDVLLTIGDPARATETGATDYRERISLMVLPADGSTARMIFQGCVPAMSPAEVEAVSRQDSAFKTFFTGGYRQELNEAAEAFRTRLISAALIAARDAPGPASPEAGRLPASSVVSSLRSSGRMINDENGLPRIVLLSNLGRIDLTAISNREQARRAGFRDGAESGLDLGLAELHVFLVDGPKESLARDYVQAFFLPQNANLIGWSDATPGMMPRAPARVMRFTGEAKYPDATETVRVRLGVDPDGALVNSWMLLRGSPNRATPMTGTIICDGEGSCRARSDDGGFAQAWSASPGGEAEFDDEAPFGGMREWTLTVEEGRMEGGVSDSAVDQVGRASGTNSIPIAAQLSD